jgi:ribonuclease Y
MDNPVALGGLVLVVTLLGVVVGMLLFRPGRPTEPVARPLSDADLQVVRSAESQAADILDKAKADADRLIAQAELTAKEAALRRKEEVTRELDAAKAEVRAHERRARDREDAVAERTRELSHKEKQLAHTKKKLAERKEQLAAKEAEADTVLAEQAAALHRLSGLTREEAAAELFARLDRELAAETAARIRRHQERLKQDAEARAREVLLTAVQRYAAEHTAESTVSTVDIPDDTMKGRIIGREGRNIRTFEKATGVDVIVDDTPGVVVVSAFDQVRRETARIALGKLITDGRIHPARIEEIVAETQAEMDKHIAEVGTAAVVEADVSMPHDKVVELLGRLKFRTSYSQNVLRHSLEVSHLCGLMACELGLDPKLARRCGLLHDVGKAADHEMEGGHPKVGAELCRRYGETSPEVLHAIAGHHDDITLDHPYTVLVAAADAISASRPGARRESLERYVKRMENLEAVACGFPEVDAAYAIQAGRELRVIANAHRATDADAVRVCREIARAIEEQLDYPGEIKVTVVRESRAVDVAR